MSRRRDIEDLLREAAPQVLAAVVRRFGDFADAEDAVQEPLDRQLSGHHRLHAVRAHLLEMAGDVEAAIRDYEAAARRTASIPEQEYLTMRAASAPWPASGGPFFKRGSLPWPSIGGSRKSIVKRVVRSTSVPIADRFRPRIRSPSSGRERPDPRPQQVAR